MGNYQRTLRMQLMRLESQRAQVLEQAEELKRRIGLIDDVLSWDLVRDEDGPMPERDHVW